MCLLRNTVQRYNNSMNYDTDGMKKFQKMVCLANMEWKSDGVWTKRASCIGYYGVTKRRDGASE